MASLRRRAGRIARRLGFRPSPKPARAQKAAPAPSGPPIAWTHPVGGVGFEGRREVLRELLALFPPGRLLDLACGDGTFAIAAHEMGWAVTAVDARTVRMPMTRGITWIEQDVRETDVEGYDVVLLLGLLYHLELPDQLDLLRRCSGTVTILDTHHSLRPTHMEGGYAGHTFHELPAGREEALAETPTAAWGNLTAFWPAQPDLVRMLVDCGFGTVLTVLPPNGPDRTLYLCLPRRSAGSATPQA
jgi:hypothetical protein